VRRALGPTRRRCGANAVRTRCECSANAPFCAARRVVLLTVTLRALRTSSRARHATPRESRGTDARFVSNHLQHANSGHVTCRARVQHARARFATTPPTHARRIPRARAQHANDARPHAPNRCSCGGARGEGGATPRSRPAGVRQHAGRDTQDATPRTRHAAPSTHAGATRRSGRQQRHAVRAGRS
jgi:hypothetical protein